MDNGRSPEGYGNPELYTQLQRQCFAQLRGYAWSPELSSLIQSTPDKTHGHDTYLEETNIIALAQREQAEQVTLKPYILSYKHPYNATQPKSEASLLDESNYIITAIGIDDLAKEYQLHPSAAVINTHQTFTGIHAVEPFNSAVVTDLQNLRIPHDIDEYSRYYEEYRSSQAYFIALAIINNAHPSLIATQLGSALYELSTVDNLQDPQHPNVSIRLFRPPQSVNQPAVPELVNITHGGTPVAYYKQAKAPSVAVDLTTGLTELTDDSLRSAYAITTVDEIIDMIQNSLLLPAHQAARMIQMRQERTEEKATHRKNALVRFIGTLLDRNN